MGSQQSSEPDLEQRNREIRRHLRDIRSILPNPAGFIKTRMETLQHLTNDDDDDDRAHQRTT